MIERKRTISDARVIAGILREALFSSVDTSVNGIPGHTVYEIVEQSRRSRSSARTFLITPAFDSADQNPSRVVVFKFPAFLVECQVSLINTTNDVMELSFPDKIVLLNRREQVRSQLKFVDNKVCEVLIRTGSDHFLGKFQASDISSSGFGGELSVDVNAKILIGSSVVGILHSTFGRVFFDGEIVKLGTSQIRGKVATYKVGAKRQQVNLMRQDIREGDRRRDIRFNSSTGASSLQFISVINPHQPFTVNIDNISVSGFAGFIEDQSFNIHKIEGLELQVVESSLTAQIVRVVNGKLHCVWVHGTEADRMFWLQLVSKRYGANISTSVSDAQDLLSIFCESGSLGSEFLRANRMYSKDFIKSLETESSNQSYAHRWIDRNEKGQIRGHISALKIGDNTWMLGDLVGGSAEDRRLDASFISKFAFSFRQYCRGLSPNPRILLFWIKGHPYWTKLNTHFQNQVPALGFSCRMGYTRTVSTELGQTRVDSNSYRKISPDQHSEIEIILGQIGQLNAFAGCMDFSVDRFGSGNLRKMIESAGHSFSREYYEINFEKQRILAIYTIYPMGANPNRIVDSAWVIPFSDATIDNDNWSHIIAIVRYCGLLEGVAVPSVRRLFSSHHPILNQEEAELECYLLHSSCLEFFSKIIQ